VFNDLIKTEDNCNVLHTDPDWDW